MKILIVCSSRTGNTKKIAEAIRDALPGSVEIFTPAAAPDPTPYDVIFVGFWAKRGGPNPAAATFLRGLSGKQLGLFGTMGARVGSAHAGLIEQNARAVAPGNTVLGVFLCPGKVDPLWLQRRAGDPSLGKVHPMTAERAARLAEAALHPDAEDCRLAGVFATEVVQRHISTHAEGFART